MDRATMAKVFQTIDESLKVYQEFIRPQEEIVSDGDLHLQICAAASARTLKGLKRKLTKLENEAIAQEAADHESMVQHRVDRENEHVAMCLSQHTSPCKEHNYYPPSHEGQKFPSDWQDDTIIQLDPVKEQLLKDAGASDELIAEFSERDPVLLDFNGNPDRGERG